MNMAFKNRRIRGKNLDEFFWHDCDFNRDMDLFCFCIFFLSSQFGAINIRSLRLIMCYVLLARGREVVMAFMSRSICVCFSSQLFVPYRVELFTAEDFLFIPQYLCYCDLR